MNFLQLEGIDNKEAIVEAVRNLRLERERQRELYHQRQEELNLIEELQAKTVRLSQELVDLRSNNQKTTPQCKFVFFFSFIPVSVFLLTMVYIMVNVNNKRNNLSYIFSGMWINLFKALVFKQSFIIYKN